MQSEALTLLAGVGSLLQETCVMLAVLLAPFVVFAVVIHWLESAIQKRLSERFGWRAVLWTGWLGTPIHELSHAAMCLVFRHRIDEIALFEPDRESGRLGYVRHSFRKGNWYEELGNVFIGIAPLIGGSFALGFLLWLFYPEAANAALESARSASDAAEPSSPTNQVLQSVWGITKEILVWSNFFTPKFWGFIYLVLCVGSHMAPSASDYRGAMRGSILFTAIIGVLALLLALIQTNVSDIISQLVGLLAPVFAVFGLTMVLCFVSTLIVHILTIFIPRFFK